MPPPSLFAPAILAPVAKAAPGHFKDTISKRATSLQLPEGFSGFERMLLTANGNLQRLLSSYFNTPVTISILENSRVPTNAKLDGVKILSEFKREVNLVCNGKIVCNAKSQIKITEQRVHDMIEHEGVGIGQLFRFLDKLPAFEIHELGRTDRTFWRDYSLKSPGVDCRMLEVIPSSLFDPNWLETQDEEEISWDVEFSQEGTVDWFNRVAAAGKTG